MNADRPLLGYFGCFVCALTFSGLDADAGASFCWLSRYHAFIPYRVGGRHIVSKRLRSICLLT